MIEELIKNINNSKWDDKNKHRILELLPLLGDNYINFLFNESGKLGFGYIGDSLTEAVSMCVAAEKNLLAGDSSLTIKILQISPQRGWWENGIYILPWVLDIQQKIRLSKDLQDSSIESNLVEFYINLFDSIPEQIVVLILKHYVFGLLKKRQWDFFSILKRYVYLKHWVDDAKIIMPFSQALLLNDELYSQGKIKVENRDLPLTIANLIKNFIADSNRRGLELTVYDITKYLISSKIVLGGDEQSKYALSEVLKIYLWLQKPSVSSKEIEEGNNGKKLVEDSLNDDLSIQDFINSVLELKPQVVKLGSDVSDVEDSGSGLRMSMGQGSEANFRPKENLIPNQKIQRPDIDKKLEDLKRKVNL
jgi:hypothetical protein